ncbi:hypothetical protein RDABS01_022933 [Bienertia sinuspersici]
MESVFQLSNGDRVSYLRNLMHSFGSSYICLWTYSPNLKYVLYISSYSIYVGVSLAQKLFNEYKQSVITVGNSIVPGLAFRDKNPCLELQELDLHSLAWSKSQRQFYLMAMFLGCERGEIEVGIQQVRNLSSSSASDYHPLLQNKIINIPFPSPESTDAALTKAYLAILSSESPTCSSSSSQSYYDYQIRKKDILSTSAFTSYSYNSISNSSSHQKRDKQMQSLFKRAIVFYRGFHFRRIQEQGSPISIRPGPVPSSTQLHHMISERRRREKINDSFQALRSLLPQPTKVMYTYILKDKASVLRTTKEYLSSLEAQLSELIKTNQALETKLAAATNTQQPLNLITNDQLETAFTNQNESVTVKLLPVPGIDWDESSFVEAIRNILADLTAS